MRFKFAAGAIFMACAGLGAAVVPASSEETIRAVYMITLKDPATGAEYVSMRWSRRSFPTVDACMRERDSFKSVHLDALKEYAFVNAERNPMEYSVEAVDCRKP